MNAMVNYTLAAGRMESEQLMVRSDTGDICVRTPLDRETAPYLEIPVIATDRGTYNSSDHWSIELCGTIILRQGTNFVFSITLPQPLPRRPVTFIRYVVLLALAFRNESSVTRIGVRKEEPREQCVSPALSRPHRGDTTQKRK